MEVGLSPSIVAGTRLETITDLETTTGFSFRSSNTRLFHLVGVISVGANYKLNDDWQLFAQPTFRYHPTFGSFGRVKENFWNAGIEAGVRLALR